MSRSRKTKKAIKQVRASLQEEFAATLKDIDWRIQQAYSVAGRGASGEGQVYAEDLNTLQHQMTGYSLTNNSPAGSIAWADVHIVYAGFDYLISNGATALRYAWFKLPGTQTNPVTMQTSATKPVLAEGDVLLFINEGGIGTNVLSMSNQTLPRVIGTNAVDNDALAGNAVEAVNIKDGAVTSLKIPDGAINRPLQLGKIVGTAQLAANAVDSTILRDGAIARTGQFGAGKIIPGGQVVDNSIGGVAVQNGALAPAKFNVLQHMMY